MTLRNRRLHGALAIGSLLAFGLTAAPARAAETSLLGIPLLSNYKSVLKKYGQPSEIQVGAPIVTNQATPGAAGSGAAGVRGGLPGFGDDEGIDLRGGGPAGRGPAGGLPGFGPPPGVGGGGLTGPPPQAMAAMMGMYGGRGPGGVPGGIPGASGSPFSGSGGSPFAGALGGGATQQEVSSGEMTWWYHYPQKGLHYSFLFNKEGKIIQIQQYGWKGGVPTKRGVGLGSSLNTVIRKYGWSNEGNPNGDKLMLQYGGKRKTAFQLVDNKVVGITVGVVN